MPFDGTYEGDPQGWHCRACRQPIMDPQRAVRIVFNNDLAGMRGLSGLYHRECSRPYESLAHAVNINPLGGL